MPTELPTWPRPHYESGGGDPFLLFLAYGDFPPTPPPPIDARRYRCGGVPAGLTLARHDRQRHADWFAGWEQGYVWERLQAENPALADAVARSPACLVLSGTIHDSPTLDYLRDAVGLMTFFLDHGGACVYDPQVFHFFDPAPWRQRIFDPAGAVPRHHVVILTSEEPDRPGLTWFHTRGMRKFGRPDLSVRNVGSDYRDAVIDLCGRFIELQAFGSVIPEGQEIRTRSLPPRGVARHAGSPDDPDFNNVHVEIAWPGDALSRR